MARETHPGWTFARGRVRPADLPLAREAAIEVRWPGGGFRVHGSPWDLDAFAVGHLVAEGLLPSLRGVLSVTVRPVGDARMRVDVELERPLRVRGTRRDNLVWGIDDSRPPRPRKDPGRRVRPEDLLGLARELRAREDAMRAEGPLHWGVLYEPDRGEFLSASDLSRHSAIDKVIGMALLSGVRVDGRMLYSTGRLGEEITAKAVRVGAGALATRSVPFRSAVDLADRCRLLLVGKLRPDGFSVFAGRDRLRTPARGTRGRPR